MTESTETPRLTLRQNAAQTPLDDRPFHESRFPDGTLWTSFHRTAGGYLLRFPNLADFTVSTDGTAVTAFSLPDVPLQTISHLFLNQVAPLAMSRQHKLVLHASAIEIGTVAAAFPGISGRGKSTLAASFCTSGHRFLTDDGLRVERSGDAYIAHPSHPSIRLWEDSRTVLIPDSASASVALDSAPKARILADDRLAFCDTTRPLGCVYFLGDGSAGGVTIDALNGSDAVIELVRHSFLLDMEERDSLAGQFDQISELARLATFFRLDYPRRYDLLPEVRASIIRHLASILPSAPV